MPEVWPVGVPDEFQADSYSETLGDGRLYTETDTGPGKVRRRSSMDPDEITGQIIVPATQVPLVRSFFKDTLASGSLPFIFPDPRAREVGMLVRFSTQSAPGIQAFTPDLYRVSIALEVLDREFIAVGDQVDPFTFADITNATPGAVYTSNPITIAGIIGSATATVVGGEMSINGEAYVTQPTQVVAGDTVIVRGTASSQGSGKINVLLTVGPVSDVFTITTADVDAIPDAFTFNTATGATPGGTYASNTITVAGTTGASDISVSGGEYSTNNAPYTSAAGTVLPGDTVTVRGVAPADYSASSQVTLLIGGVQGTFTITTAAAPPAADTTPDAFAFSAVTGAQLNALVLSNEITVSGINAPATIAVLGGDYQVNGGGWQSTQGTVVNGDAVRIRLRSSASATTTTSATLTIGGVSARFDVTTISAAVDTTPDAFVFQDVTGVVLSAQVTSNAITITGTNAPSTISVSGGSYSVNNGPFTTQDSTVNPGDTVRVRHTSSSSYQTATNTVLTVGGVQDTFTSTTAAVDTTPNQFTFTDVVNATEGAYYISNQITISGINAASNLTISGGEYSKNGGPYTAISTAVQNGDTITVRVIASQTPSATVNAVLTIGGVSDTYSVKTRPAISFYLDKTDVDENLPADTVVGNLIDTTPAS